MAQTGYTPILNYSSATASAVPLAANLSQGELAVNTADGKLFYKDSSGVVQTMASKATGSIGGSTTQVQFNNSGVLGGSANLTFNGTTLTAAGLAGPHNGTVGATTPATGAFTTVTATGGVDKLTTASGVVSVAASAAPTAGQVLTATSGTVATWQTPTVGGSVAGSNTQVQYNNAGAFGASANLTFDGTTLTAAGLAGPHNGTVGATTANTGAFTTVSASGNVTLSGGASNSVAYLNASKVLTTGSGLTFDGSAFGLSTATARMNYTSTTGANATVTAYNNTGGAYFLGVENSAGNYLGVGLTAYSLFRYAPAGRTIEDNIAGVTVTKQSSTGLAVTGTLSSSADATIYGLTVGRGGGAVAGNTAVGASAMAATATGAGNSIFGAFAGQAITSGTTNTGIGYGALNAVTTTSSNTAVGYSSLQKTTGSNNTAVGEYSQFETLGGSSNTSIGSNALRSNTTGPNNTAVGYQAGYSNTTGDNLVAIGYRAAYSHTTNSYSVAIGNYALYTTNGTGNVAVGYQAQYYSTTGSSNNSIGYRSLFNNTTGGSNQAFGQFALYNNTTASNNTALGESALYFNTTTSSSVAVGYEAMYANTSGDRNTAVGYQAARTTTTGRQNTSVGFQAFYANTTGNYNCAFGEIALSSNTTGSSNTTFGFRALASSTTADNNTAVGQQALYNNTTASSNTAVGYQAGYSNTTGATNVFVGYQSGNIATTGTQNTFIGPYSGNTMTTGSKNVIIGGWNGSSGGLDIRTSSNYIVLSDGDGNPRQVIDSSGNLCVGRTSSSFGGIITAQFSAASQVGLTLVDTYTSYGAGSNYQVFVNSGGVAAGTISHTGATTVSYNTSSDYRLKEDIQPMTGALAKVVALKPVTYKWKEDGSDGQGFIAHELQEVVPECVTGAKDAVYADGSPQYQGIDTSFLVATLTAAIQEQQALIQDLTTRLAALEAK